MSLEEDEEVPEAQSPFSRRATRRPRREASREVQAP
jgi:hypothetical protein